MRAEVTGISSASWRRALGAYIGLMKPHVTVLLLGTTLAAMAVAGLPSLPVVLATLVGGALAAGSANAINCYWDRDIDQIMSQIGRASCRERVESGVAGVGRCDGRSQ